MKIFRTKERKFYASVLIVGILLIACWSAFGTITITDTGTNSFTISDVQDERYQMIRNSNGNYWDSSGANLQLAIWDLNGTGGEVELPGSTISCSAVINLISNITIIGKGYSTLLFLEGGSDCDIIDITSRENIHIEKIRFDGNNASNTDNPLIDIQSAGAGNAHTKNITIRDCWFFNCGTSMVDVHYDDNTWWLKVEDCFFNGIEREIGKYPAGIWMSGFNAILKNNWIENTYACGIVIEASSAELMASNIVIDSNFVTGYTGYGILVEGGGDTANITVVNNHCWELYSIAYFAPESSYSTGIRCTGNSTIANNYVHDVYRHGIYADGNYTIVTGNVIEDVETKEGIQISGNGIVSNNIIRNIHGNVGGAGRGIRACNEWFDNCRFIITGNYIENCDSSAIHVDTAGGSGSIQGCVVSNNIIDTVAGDGLDLDDVENSTIMGNTFANYGGLAIDEASTCYNNTFIGNTARDAGNDYDFDGGGSAVGVEIIANVGQIA